MLQQHNKHIKNLIWNILDDKLREIESNNEELREQQYIFQDISNQFDKVFGALSQQDRDIVDLYLSTQNNMNCLTQYDLYCHGIRDGVKLLKDLQVI